MNIISLGNLLRHPNVEKIVIWVQNKEKKQGIIYINDNCGDQLSLNINNLMVFKKEDKNSG